MITEHEHEPVRGLPGELPEGEAIVWQGAPDWRIVLRTVLKARWVAGYFAVLAIVSLASGSTGGALASVIGGAAILGMLAGFAVLVERTTVYTITTRRVVFRVGVALDTCINVPLKLIGAAHLREHGGTAGDIALQLVGRQRIGYAILWPHVRPFKLRDAQPMLRALPDAQPVAALLAKACGEVVETVRGDMPAPAREPQPRPQWEEAAA